MSVDDVTREAVGSWTGERRVGGRRAEVGGRRPREAVGGWRAERRQLRLDRREANSREVGLDPRRGRQHQNTGTERRGDKIGSSEEESQDV